MEDVYDLLAAKDDKEKKGCRLKLRETVDDGVMVEGLLHADISCVSDALELMRVGEARRSTATTDMNRCHCHPVSCALAAG